MIQVNARYTDLLPGDTFTHRGITYRVIANHPEIWELTAAPDGGEAILFLYN